MITFAAAKMNLIIDIGNTASKYFLFDNGQLWSHRQELGHSLHSLPHPIGEEESPRTTATAAIVSTVVTLSAVAKENLKALDIPTLRLTADTPVPIRNEYRTPESLGSDRLAAAVGAWAQQPGKPLLIIDAGSCITYDFVSADGAYQGGNIAPGLHARLNSINDYFPRLPLIKPEGDTPELGYDTETAIRAGVIEGMRHEIDGYIHHFQEKYPSLLVFLTGGDANHFVNTIKSPIFADPFLVPRGLNHILEYNKKYITIRK